MSAQQTFHLRAKGPFSFAQSARFLTGWGPPANSLATNEGHVHAAFVPQGEDAVTGVCLREEDGGVACEIFGDADSEVVQREVERILSLDIDGSGYPEVGERDPIVGRLQEQYPGLRPALFFSPLEAAAWGILSQRVQLRQAVKVKAAMARVLGESIEIHGDRLFAFPGCVRLMEVTDFPGLFGRKAEYLRGLGHADDAGKLDALRLRVLPFEVALAEIRRIPGLGEFSAHLVLARGIGVQDCPPSLERRFLRALTLAYGFPGEPSPDEVARISEGWRPYRSWVTLTLRAFLADREN